MRAHRQSGAASLLILALGAVGGLVVAAAVTQLAASGDDTPELKYVGAAIVGLLALLHIIKEVRYLMGHPPRRRTDDNIIQQVAETNERLGGLRAELARLAEIAEHNAAEIQRLRNTADGLDDRIGRAVSRVASQTQGVVASMETRFGDWRAQADRRLAHLERSR